ncbi:hypothetical protein IFT66_14280 [Rhizobium sp. CFBP 13726]|uniref:hypothetical protein n=1 Tax=Rhizobium sp. CFBP 13726 TaxID=2775296 RepID=UPI0017845E27|nr:hypothetical protein [Rhizobium sp. CFBP 13726]MBD8652252.1 hypothetical protein [Rhizobium sp. CFBP 13726]
MSANDGLIAGGRLNLLSLSGQLQLAYGSSIFAETIGQLLQIPRNDGELLADYAERLTVAVQSMSAVDVAALEKTLSQLVKGLSVPLLAEILKNPGGLDAARLILSLEAALVSDSDTVENAAVTSYRQNEIASATGDDTKTSLASRTSAPSPSASLPAPSALQPSTPSPASPVVPLPGSSPDTASTETPRPSPGALPDIGAKSQSVTSPATSATPPATGAAAPALAPFSPPTSGSAAAAPDTKVPGKELQRPQLLPPLVDLQEEPTREAILARPMPVRSEGPATATSDLQTKPATPSPAVPNAVPIKPDASPAPAQAAPILAADAKPVPQVLQGALPRTAVPGIATVTNTGALVAAVIDAFDNELKIPQFGDATTAPKPAVEWPSNLAQLVSAIAPSALQAALLATGAPVENSTAALFKNLFGGGGSGTVAHAAGQGQPAPAAPDIDAMHTAGITHPEDDLLRIAERHTTAAKANGAPEGVPDPDIQAMPVPLPLVQREAIGLPFVPYPMADDEPRRENRKTQPVTAIDEDGEGDHSQGQAFDHPDDGKDPSDDDNLGDGEAASADVSNKESRPNDLYWRMAGWT